MRHAGTHFGKAALLVTFLLCAVAGATAGPRDYVAILNRCGAPTLGDTTIYEDNTVAGGRKIVKYLRGTLHFNRVGNDGWTFMFGDHEKQENLDAQQMAVHMPCLTQALADSAAPAPIVPIKADQRLEFSAKYHWKFLVAAGILLVLLVLGGVFSSRRRRVNDEDEE